MPPTEEQIKNTRRRMMLDDAFYSNPGLSEQIYASARLFEQQRRATEAQRRLDQHAADCSDAARRAQIAVLIEEQRIQRRFTGYARTDDPDFVEVDDPRGLPSVKEYVKKKKALFGVDQASPSKSVAVIDTAGEHPGWTYLPDPPLKPPAIVVREETATDRAAGLVPLPSVKKVIVEDNGPRVAFPAGAFPARAMR